MSDPNIPHAEPVPGQPVSSVPIDYTPTRPTSVTVLSILGIIFGILGLICVPLGLVSYFIPAVEQSNPAIAAVKGNVPLFAWVLASNLFGMVLSIVLVIAAAGSLKLLGWARRLMIAYSVVAILVTVVVVAVNLAWLTPIMAENSPANIRQFVNVSSYVGGLIGLLFGLTLPILNLIFFRKQDVVDAFERRLSI